MKNCAHPFALLLLFVAQAAFSQTVEKTLISTISMKGQKTLLFNPEGEVEIRKGSGEFVQVQATISLENASESILKSLVQAGRYQLKSVPQNDGLNVEAPGLKKQVTIGGVVLVEKVNYVLLVPENITVRLAKEADATMPN